LRPSKPAPLSVKPLRATRFDWNQEAVRAQALVKAGEWVIEEEPPY
jgi:hypothetical protein